MACHVYLHENVNIGFGSVWFTHIIWYVTTLYAFVHTFCTDVKKCYGINCIRDNKVFFKSNAVSVICDKTYNTLILK